MNISPILFFGLIFLAIIPAYLVAFYAMFALKQLYNIMTKEQELQLAALGGLRKGLEPLYTTSVDMKDFLDILQKKKDVKGTSDGDGKVPAAGSGHYL